MVKPKGVCFPSLPCKWPPGNNQPIRSWGAPSNSNSSSARPANRIGRGTGKQIGLDSLRNQSNGCQRESSFLCRRLSQLSLSILLQPVLAIAMAMLADYYSSARTHSLTHLQMLLLS